MGFTLHHGEFSQITNAVAVHGLTLYPLAEGPPIGSHCPGLVLPAARRAASRKDLSNVSVTDTDLSGTVVPDWWTDIDSRAVDTIRVLAADAVQHVGNGHPGTAMSLAPVAYLLFQRVMRHNPSDPNWPGRDRFVLSCGHTSLTIYIQLYLGGFGLSHPLAKKMGPWPAVLTVAGASAGASWLLADRKPAP